MYTCTLIFVLFTSVLKLIFVVYVMIIKHEIQITQEENLISHFVSLK
jgi:hypothetical protein